MTILVSRALATLLALALPVGGLAAANAPKGGAASSGGRVENIASLALPTLGEERRVRVYLPPSYVGSPTRRYPVLYLYDGERLFDTLSLGLIADGLAREGIELILVAVDPRERTETTPTSAYLTDLVRTVKPLVDARYRTNPVPDATGIAGVASGGSVSIEGGTRYPDVFGFVGAISPLMDARGHLVDDIWTTTRTSRAYYLSVGTSEGTNDEASLARLMDAGRLLWALQANGARVGYVEVDGAASDAAAWQARLPGLLRTFSTFTKSASGKN